MSICPALDVPLRLAGAHGILVVEDDPALAYAMTCLLEDRYRLHLALTGERALTLVQQQKNIDLVLLDYRLPDRSGIEVLQKIKTARPSLPVIMITGWGSEEVAIKAFTSGARDYIRKPFTHTELLAKIEFCLSLRSSHQSARTARTLAQPQSWPTAGGRLAHSGHQNFYKIQKAVKYIEDNFTFAITLDAAASRACISPYHFSRLFKDIMGVTFKHYLVGLRIEKAKEILKQGSRKISEIGDSVGYDEPAHFVKIFKQRTGCTPSEYRRSQMAIDRDKMASS